MKTEQWFGMDSSSPLSLTKRLWAELVLRLSGMEVVQDAEEKTLYHFKSSTALLSIRITYKPWEEGTLLVVEFLDENKAILVREEIVDAGLSLTHDWHPLSELEALVRVRNQKIGNIQALLKTVP